MSPDYYYHSGGQRTGPVTEGRLRELLASGRVRPEDLVWREGMPDWVPAAQVPGLIPSGEAPAPRSGVAATITMSPAGQAGSNPAGSGAGASTRSVQTLLRNPAVLAGGGCVVTGLLLSCLLGLFLSCGGCLGGGRNPARLVGEWESKVEFFGVKAAYVLDLKADGQFNWRGAVDFGVTNTASGTWRVDRVVDGNYKVQVVFDTEPDRTYGWVIAPVGDDRIRPEGDLFERLLDGTYPTYTRKK